MRDSAHATSKRPFQGLGVSARIREPLARSARVRVPFSAPKQEGRIQKVLPFLFCMPVHEGLGTCDLKTPLPGAGGVCHNSRNRSRAARVRVPFSAPKQKGEPSEGSPFACSAVAVRGWRRTRMLRIFRIVRMPWMPWMPWTPRGCSGPAGRKRPDGVFCCRFGRPVRRASVGGGLLRAISAAPTAVPHPCVCGASGRASTPRAP